MNNNNKVLGSSSRSTGDALYETGRDKLSGHASQQYQSGQSEGLSSTQFGRNDANTNLSNQSSTSSPLGSLRDLINQKTGNSHGSSHLSDREPVQNSTSSGSRQQERLANSLSQPNSTSRNETSNRDASIPDRQHVSSASVLPSSGSRNLTGSSAIGTADQRNISGGSYQTTGMTGATRATGGYGTSGDYDTTSTSRGYGKTGTTGMTGTSGDYDTTSTTGGYGKTGATGMADTTGTTSAYNTTSSNMQQPRGSSMGQTSTSTNQDSRGGAKTAVSQGIGTGAGLLGSYDFLRTSDKTPSDSSALNTSGPDHIAPPPGSREPPTSNSTSRYNQG